MFEVRFAVREYEIDSQGVVNHAIYVNYLEHARSFYLRAHGFEYAELVEQGLHLMVAHMSFDFREPLRSGDEALIRLTAERVGAKLHFHQQILRGADDKVCVTATTHIVCVQSGRVTRGEFFDHLVKDLENNRSTEAAG
jgi:acyl-CoA thioester hydrolase